MFVGTRTLTLIVLLLKISHIPKLQYRENHEIGLTIDIDKIGKILLHSYIHEIVLQFTSSLCVLYHILCKEYSPIFKK